MTNATSGTITGAVLRPLLLLLPLLLSCAQNTGVELSVDVRTDLVPGRTFIGVRVEHLTLDRARTLNRTDTIATLSQDYFNGHRVADFEGVPRGPQIVEVTLLSADGDEVARRATTVDLSSSYAVTVVLTASCSGVTCPGGDDDPTFTACHGGQCVDPRCSVETPEFCGPQTCTSDSECTSPVECGVPSCNVGVCFVRLDDGLCSDGLVCDVDGCVPDPTMMMMDAGPSDSGPPCSESETFCSDGEDDDCDGLIDCRDPDCEAEACDDGDNCTTDDVCTDAAVCGGTPVVCDDGNECTDDACDPETGACTSADNTAACDDGSWCNGTDRCAGGTCSEHTDPPCPSFCNEDTMRCEACRSPSDCGDVTYGDWSSCGGFGGTCGENGTRSRMVTTPTCTAGMCGTDTSMETEACTRDTDGNSCGSVTYGSWGSCGSYSGTCDETGSRSREVRTPTCGGGTCNTVITSQSGSCSRDTDGNSCGSTTYSSWGSCGGFSNACDTTGTQSRTRTDRVCRTGSCRSEGSPESRGCSRSVSNGTRCGGTAWHVCCSGTCRDTRNNNSYCGTCNQSCRTGLTCAATGTGGYACRGCTANSQCTGALDSSATCWNVSSPPAFCQCQCPGAGHQVCSNAGCGSGMYCHDVSGHNWCAPFP